MAARHVLSMMPPVQNRKPRVFRAIGLRANLLEIEVSEVDGISNEIEFLLPFTLCSKQYITLARITITFARITVTFACLISVICVCLRTLVSNTKCVVFLLFFFVLCDLCCQLLWIVHFWLSLWYSLKFIYQCFSFITMIFTLFGEL